MPSSILRQRKRGNTVRYARNAKYSSMTEKLKKSHGKQEQECFYVIKRGINVKPKCAGVKSERWRFK